MSVSVLNVSMNNCMYICLWKCLTYTVRVFYVCQMYCEYFTSIAENANFSAHMLYRSYYVLYILCGTNIVHIPVLYMYCICCTNDLCVLHTHCACSVQVLCTCCTNVVHVLYVWSETAADDLTEMDVSAVSSYSHSRLDHSQLGERQEERYNEAQLRIQQLQTKAAT